MVKPQQLSNNKKVLQDQVVRLNNEIEELRLEREESKKNVLHFMQEADGTRKELERTQALLDELSSCQMGLQSPPPEQTEKPKISDLLSRLCLLEEKKINELFQLLEQPDLKQQLDETRHQLKVQTMENLALQEELDQTRQEYKATRAALQIENERAEIIEKRWKESESSLEHAEDIIQSLNQDLNYFRQQQQQQECNATTLLDKSLPNILENQTLEELNLTLVRLEQKEVELKEWQEKYQSLFENYTKMENKQTELEASKVRENHLRTVNKTLRDEVRKVNKVQGETVNIEYLRNVMIKFLEKRQTRAQLVPILSTLLQCSHDERIRLSKLIRNKIT